MSSHRRTVFAVLLFFMVAVLVSAPSIWAVVSHNSNATYGNYLPLVQAAKSGTLAPSETPISTATSTPSATPSGTATVTLTSTATPSPTNSPTPTATSTATPTPTTTLAVPTPGPSPTVATTPCPTAASYHYCDDFTDLESGWPVFDHTQDPIDCSKAYYEGGEYKIDICRDRAIRMLSPLVSLPDGDYVLQVKARFRANNRWWTSYGIAFEAAFNSHILSEANTVDHYLLWVLWEGNNVHKWKVRRTVSGEVYDLTPWENLPGDVYNYGESGLAWNTWRIERTDSTIKILLNDSPLAEVSESRPDVNTHNKFGLYSAVYETDGSWTAFDYYIIGH